MRKRGPYVPLKPEVKTGGRTIPLRIIIDKGGCDKFPIRRINTPEPKKPELVPA